MSIYLVRHAKAGSRDRWNGDDRQRPLSDKGRVQAELLAERFVRVPVPRIFSSPYVRCVETVEPLSRACGVDIESIEVLAEAGSFASIIDLLLSVPEHTVLCSHGDTIPETIAALCRRGMEIDGPEDWRKGSTWVLDREGELFTHATAWTPPRADGNGD